AEWVGLQTIHSPLNDSGAMVTLSEHESTEDNPDISAPPEPLLAPQRGGKAALMWTSLAIAVLVCLGTYLVKLRNRTTAYNASPAPLRPESAVLFPPIRDGLVLYLSLDQPADRGELRDQSGQSNHGIPINAQWTPQGRRGGAYRFNGTNSYIKVPFDGS